MKRNRRNRGGTFKQLDTGVKIDTFKRRRRYECAFWNAAGGPPWGDARAKGRRVTGTTLEQKKGEWESPYYSNDNTDQKVHESRELAGWLVGHGDGR